MKADNLRKISQETFYRVFTFAREAVNEKARTVELAFSSELPVERWWGTEILDHSPQSVRMGRMRDGAPLLLEHSSNQLIGVVEAARIDADRIGRATVRFSSSRLAQEVFQDVLDGIRSKVSVGYRIHEMTTEKIEGQPGDNAQETLRAMDWEPLEVSLVAVPADATVGVGRTLGALHNQNKEAVMALIDKPTGASPEPTDANEQRKAQLANFGRAFPEHATAALEAMDSDESFTTFAARLLKSKPAPVPLSSPDGLVPDENVDEGLRLDPKDMANFRWLRAIRALANPKDSSLQKAAGHEFEISRAAAKHYNKDPQGLLVPMELLRFRNPALQTRDLTAGTDSLGGYLVANDLLAGSFIDLLRNKALMMRMGTVLMGLKGDVDIPKISAGATAYHLAEDGTTTESQQTFAQVAMRPKTVAALTEITRRLLLQSSLDVEALVKNDLAAVIGLAVDYNAIAGPGTGNQPTGILSTSGIGDVAGGTNGLAPTWAHVVGLESEVALDNADVGRLAYLTNAKVRGKLKQTAQVGSVPPFIWEKGEQPLNGYAAEVTNQVPSNLVKGSSGAVCSAIIFGNFADLVLGFWSGLDVTVDPYTSSATGRVRLVIMQDYDVAIRHAESFAAMKDALTT